MYQLHNRMQIDIVRECVAMHSNRQNDVYVHHWMDRRSKWDSSAAAPDGASFLYILVGERFSHLNKAIFNVNFGMYAMSFI